MSSVRAAFYALSDSPSRPEIPPRSWARLSGWATAIPRTEGGDMREEAVVSSRLLVSNSVQAAFAPAEACSTAAPQGTWGAAGEDPDVRIQILE